MFLHVSCNCLMVGDFIPTFGGMDAAGLLIPMVPSYSLQELQIQCGGKAYYYY